MDRDIVLWLADHRLAVLDAVATVLAVAGTGGLVWIVIALVASRLRPARLARLVVPVAVTVWVADLIALGLRHLVGRVRPYEAIAGVDSAISVGGTGPSFPSGHATTGGVGALLLAYMLRGAVPPPRARVRTTTRIAAANRRHTAPTRMALPPVDPTLAGAVLLGFRSPSFAAVILTRTLISLGLLIAASRVYAGVHYPTDVLAGLALGSVIGLVAISVVRRFAPRGGVW